MTCFPRIVAVLLFAAGTAFAQAPADLGSRFARATITENEKPLLMGTIFKDTADNLVVLGAPLVDVIARAYGVEAYQVVDAPEWVYRAHVYDIEAVPPPAALVKADETRMLRALLADRFGLRTYKGAREVTIAVLDADFARQRALRVQGLGRDVALYASRRPPAMTLGGPRARYVLRRLPVLSGLPVLGSGAASSSVSTRAVITSLTRGAREPVLDLTGLGTLYLVGAPAVRSIPENMQLMTEALKRSGLGFEHRAVPLSVLVVTAVERPELDVVDR